MPTPGRGVPVNDVHSRLNATTVSRVESPRDLDELRSTVRACSAAGEPFSIAGARHAMGGQQFLSAGVLIDTRALDQPLAHDSARGLLRIGAGAAWPQVMRAANAVPADHGAWSIRQKQTGADDLTLGGSVSCNAHGRGLAMGPLVDDIEALTLLTPQGEAVECSRDRNADLFAHAVGGYGLFGIIADATLRLVKRTAVRRLVDIIDLEDAVNAVYRRAAQGCTYGDFQYAIDLADDSFLRRGVMACYQVVEGAAPDDGGADLSRDDWLALLKLAHTDKRRAFARYASYYLESHGRLYWSDAMQLGTYIPTYAEFLAESHDEPGRPAESLMITELYVPPPRILEFMVAARAVLRATGVEDIYGTIRAIRGDATTILPWAREDYACVIFNLRTIHTPAGLEQTRRAARALIDAAIALSGSFYLTYHRWATREQLLTCYPRLPDFLRRKRELDPKDLLRSDWYDHLCATLAGAGP